jgi:hypothetical protein
MASISGQSTGSISQVDGFFTSQGGTASITPTLATIVVAGTAISTSISNIASYDDSTMFQVIVQNSSSAIVVQAEDVTVTTAGALSWTDAATAGVRTLAVVALNGTGDEKSAAVAGTYTTTVAANPTYYRISGRDASGNPDSRRLGVMDFRVYTALSYGGTMHPPHLTSNSSNSLYVARPGHFFHANYDAWKAFNSNISTAIDAYISNGTTAANNWLNLEFTGSGPTILSGKIRFGLYTQCTHFRLETSTTGAFTGEEILVHFGPVNIISYINLI